MSHLRTLVAALGFATAAVHAPAAVILHSLPNTGEAPAGFVSNDITADSDYDLTVAAVYIELAVGSVYNPNPTVAGVETFQQSPGDTFITFAGNPGTSIAGSAGDLGHQSFFGGEVQFGPRTVGVAYYTTSTNDVGVGLPMGTFSFTSDAVGKGRFIVHNNNDETAYVEFNIANGSFPANFDNQLPGRPGPDPLPPLDPGPIDPDSPVNVTGFFQTVDQVFLPGQIVNDLMVYANRDWGNASVLIELDQGAVTNPGSSNTPAPSEFVEMPGLEFVAFDTYVGVRDDNTTAITGGAAIIPGGGVFSMSGQRVDVSWTNSLITDYGTFPIGRFILTDDASGTAKINVDGFTATFPIVAGVIIPEPATPVFLLITAPVLLRRRAA